MSRSLDQGQGHFGKMDFLDLDNKFLRLTYDINIISKVKVNIRIKL